MGEEVDSPRTEEENDFSHLFTVDNNPTHVLDDLDIPVYSSKFGTLTEKVEKLVATPKTPKPSRVTCWNCEGDHNLRDCKAKRNFAVINQKRAESQARYSKTSRYHADDEQRFAHLSPGIISQALRDALGLNSDQAPPHIYKMRELGYPPGWVEEAKISHSGISMFDSQGQEVKDPELEDGEIKAKEDRDKYDVRRLIEYPGFNVPFEEGITDETEKYNAHPMREIQSLKHMLRLWSGKKMGAYKRKKLTATQTTPTDDDSPYGHPQPVATPQEDMELDAEEGEIRLLPPTDNCGFIPPLPDSSPVIPPPPPPGETPTSSPVTGVKRKSLGEEDDDEDEDSPAKVQKVEVTSNELEDSGIEAINEKTTEIKNVSSPNLSDSFNGRVKSVSSGTPVITRSEFKRLPDPEKFSKNICDVINFENLPNATGKYEQMRGLVQKVREYVTTSNSKSDESDIDE